MLVLPAWWSLVCKVPAAHYKCLLAWFWEQGPGSYSSILCFVNSLTINLCWVKRVMHILWQAAIIGRPQHLKERRAVLRRLIRKGALCSLQAVVRVCVCVCVCLWVCFLVCVGVECSNKAALCLVNLSHKCQLAVCYAIVTEMHTCIMLHMATLSHPQTHMTPTPHCHPRVLRSRLHRSDTQRHPPAVWMQCVRG